MGCLINKYLDVIEYKQIPNTFKQEKTFHSAKYNLVINGIVIKDILVTGHGFEDKSYGYNIYSNNQEIAEQIIKFKWKDFELLDDLNLKLNSENGLDLRLLLEKDRKQNVWYLDIYFEPQLLNWRNNFSYDDFELALLKEVKTIHNKFISVNNYKDEDHISIEFQTELILGNETIKEELSEYLDFIEKLYNQTAQKLEAKNREDTILTFFNFPENLKNSCEQYLLYFAKFLRDLGIYATSNLKEEAGKVLFSVMPTDDIKALDKIREALAIYLNLPASPIVYDDSFAAMRLQQQIENLQHSQKMTAREIRAGEREMLLAQTVIEQQDNLIRQKDTTIEQQNRIIEKITSKSIMMDSVENKEEFEQIYDGVRIGESKWLKELTGIGLNPVKAVKKAVDNTFGKPDENKSILGLEDEDQV